MWMKLLKIQKTVHVTSTNNNKNIKFLVLKSIPLKFCIFNPDLISTSLHRNNKQQIAKLISVSTYLSGFVFVPFCYVVLSWCFFRKIPLQYYKNYHLRIVRSLTLVFSFFCFNNEVETRIEALGSSITIFFSLLLFQLVNIFSRVFCYFCSSPGMRVGEKK